MLTLDYILKVRQMMDQTPERASDSYLPSPQSNPNQSAKKTPIRLGYVEDKKTGDVRLVRIK